MDLWNDCYARCLHSGRVWYVSFAFANFDLQDPDTIPYFVLFVSCLRANYVPFPISPRNSASAVAHLIFEAGVSHLLIGHEPAMIHLAESAVTILKEKYPLSVVPDVSYIPLFEDIFISDTPVVPEALPFEYHGPDATAYILHSSGIVQVCLPSLQQNWNSTQVQLHSRNQFAGRIFARFKEP
jgi:acyl-CoA synthetase (AMP-forming)/AMP-acid ligase II